MSKSIEKKLKVITGGGSRCSAFEDQVNAFVREHKIFSITYRVDGGYLYAFITYEAVDDGAEVEIIKKLAEDYEKLSQGEIKDIIENLKKIYQS